MMKKHFRYFAALAMCGLLVACTSACRKKQAQPTMPPSQARTALAVKQDTPVVITTFGATKDRMSVDVLPQVSGRLVQTMIADGAVVTNNQPLFLIDPSDYLLGVRQAEGQLTASRANLELSRLTLERNQPLLAKHMISQEQFDSMKAKLDADAAQLLINEAALEQARLDLSRCTVTATVAGVCSRREIDDGNLVAANQTKLTNIRSYDPMLVDLTVSEKDLGLLRSAMQAGEVRVELTPSGDTNCYEGKLVFLDNAVDRRTGTIALRGQIPNPDHKLWANQFVEIRIFAGMARQAVMVPESAVQFGLQGPYVFVVKDQKADLRLVKPGVRYAGQIQIIEGVASDERVVVLGQLMLFPGAPVAEAASEPKPHN